MAFLVASVAVSLLYHRNFDSGATGKYFVVANRLRPSSCILEIGCHTGGFSRYLMTQGHTVLGVDNDESAIKVARDAGVNAICRDVSEDGALAFLDRQFDVLLLMDVLEHLPRPDVVLSRLRTAVKPGGDVLITGPNVAYWRVRLDLLRGKFNYEDAGIMDRTHLRFFTAETWSALVSQAGYEIIHFCPAESMIPLEGRIRWIPLAPRVTPHLRAAATKALPNLFAIVFLIHARPA